MTGDGRRSTTTACHGRGSSRSPRTGGCRPPASRVPGSRSWAHARPAAPAAPSPGGRRSGGGPGRPGRRPARGAPARQPHGQSGASGCRSGRGVPRTHVGGFMAAADQEGLVAVIGVALATRGVARRTSRASAAVAGASALTLLIPGSLGWYAFLAAFFAWTAMVARRWSGCKSLAKTASDSRLRTAMGGPAANRRRRGPGTSCPASSTYTGICAERVETPLPRR